MEKRKIKVVNLQRIQKLLLGEITLEAMIALPTLTKKAFDGDGYQMARVSKVTTSNEVEASASTASSEPSAPSQPPAATTQPTAQAAES